MANYYVADDGSYYTQGTIDSSYDGFCVFEDHDLIKIVERFGKTERPSITNHENGVFLQDGKTQQSIYIEDKTLTFDFQEMQRPILELDIRKIHDHESFDKKYDVKATGNGLLIHYTKSGGTTYDFYVAIKTTEDFLILKDWKKHKYEYDERRGTENTFYSYKLLQILSNSGRVDIRKGTKKELQKWLASSQETKTLGEEQDTKAMIQDAMNSLRIDDTSYIAGHPWFFQTWSRDELIGLIGIIEEGKKDQAKNVLTKYWEILRDEHELFNRYPPAGLWSADATGWFFKRVDDYRKAFGTDSLLEDIGREGKDILREYKENHIENGLVYNDGLETWMDTGEGYDERRGYRIEIQALLLQSFQTVHTISDDEELREWEDELKQNVKEALYDDRLLDGLHPNLSKDKTVRPNVFLAYYLYPELLSDTEWEETFDNVLQTCWLDWGGISSISKRNDLYESNHTGIDNKSYHRGDSWYFINNIAAICLQRLDADKYHSYIQKIIQSSEKDLLHQGYIGTCSEISSAEHQESFGCFNQFWSNATFLELLNQDQTLR